MTGHLGDLMVFRHGTALSVQRHTPKAVYRTSLPRTSTVTSDLRALASEALTAQRLLDKGSIMSTTSEASPSLDSLSWSWRLWMTRSQLSKYPQILLA